MAINTPDNKVKQTTDNINKIVKDGITYYYQFDWVSVSIMGAVAVGAVVFITAVYWFLDQTKK